MKLDDVADADAREQFFDVAIAETNTSVRNIPTDEARLVGAVDAIAFQVQADPTRADGIIGAGGNHFAGMIVNRIRDAINDAVLARRAGTLGRSDGNMKFQDNAAIFNDGENTIRDADDNASVGGNGR
jgi:hypothetical protein